MGGTSYGREKSKFDYLSFTDGFFAVNKDKYTKEEAVQLFLDHLPEGVLFGLLDRSGME